MLKNIKEYAADRKAQIRESLTGVSANLAIVQVGNVEASNRYIRNKVKDCEEVGIIAHVYHYPEDIGEMELFQEVKDLNEHYNGIIVQLPLPEHINKDFIGSAIAATRDVDGFQVNSLYKPATPLGIMEYLEDCGIGLSGTDVVIIGRSDIVGKPLAQMMTDADATVTLCHSKTQRLWDYISHADLIISAVGQANFLNCYSIHVPVIDVGINFNEEGKLVGDCFNTEGRDVTPVPGGVGLLTRLALLENVARSAGVLI